MSNGLLRVVTGEELQKKQALDLEAAAPPIPVDELSDLAQHVRTRWELFRRHRTDILATAVSDTTFNSNNGGDTLNSRLLASLRSYQGVYTPQKLAEIGLFGGSQVFSKLTAVKCRGATAMLRDIFLNGDRTWDLAPTPNPEVPQDVAGNIDELVMMEAMHLQQAGQPVQQDILEKRRRELQEAAKKAAQKQAHTAAREASDYLDDYLVEGGFYEAMQEFLTDLPIYYLACIKGPVVQMEKQLTWGPNGEPVIELAPKMCWYRVSPFDFYWTPGATDIRDAEVIEKVRYTRADLNALIGVPGFDEEAIRKVLDLYSDGYMEYPDEFESERSDLESREDFHLNRSGMIEGLEFHGSVQGKKLLDAGLTEKQVPDPTLDYSVVVWQIADIVLKAQINPNPKERHPYYVSSFEKVPGSIPGNGVTDIIDDIQDVANAALRSLVNNMSIASGPQVAVDEERLGPNTDADSLYPWKRWRFMNDPAATDNKPPISFFQPQSNAQELMAVFNAMSTLADETSAIPRYLTGGKGGTGGAASTASGLSMLMNNASKVLQNVAAQIDGDIYHPILQDLYTYVMLTDPKGLLKGDENIQVKGVTVAMQKEQDRMRKLEYLNMTGNPIDSQIIGPTGRAAILRDLANDLGMPGEKIVPSEADLEAQQQQALAAQQAMVEGGQPPGNGNQAPNPGGGERVAAELDNAFRVTQ